MQRELSAADTAAVLFCAYVFNPECMPSINARLHAVVHSLQLRG